MHCVVGKIAHFWMGVFFLYGAHLQSNDPNPVRWVSLYLLSAFLALVSVMELWHSRLWHTSVAVLSTLLGCICFLCALTILQSQFDAIPPNLLLWIETEAGRDISGLLIIGVEMIAISWTHWKNITRIDNLQQQQQQQKQQLSYLFNIWYILAIIVAITGITASFWLPNYLQNKGIQGTPEYCAYEKRKW